jgi:hypothetical protein
MRSSLNAKIKKRPSSVALLNNRFMPAQAGIRFIVARNLLPCPQQLATINACRMRS